MMLSICMPYYRNPMMLAEHYRLWSAYPADLKAAIELVLVDDGSPEPALAVGRPDGLPRLRLYRVLVDLPWHQHGARNLAAREAAGPWLFLTDMDHALPAESLRQLLTLLKRSPVDAVYRFRRLDAPALTPTVDAHGDPKLHVNTFALSQQHFWAIGGYDEDCVGYGTDGYFRRRLFAEQRPIDLADIAIVRYPREVIPDASTTPDIPMDPRAFRNAGRRSGETQRRLAAKKSKGIGPKVLAFPWERVL